VLRIVQNKYMSTYREMKDDFKSDDTAFIIHNVELRLEVKYNVFSSLSYSKLEDYKKSFRLCQFFLLYPI